jgi:hypothetical protein
VTGERQCRGRTKRGERCRRVVAACAVHCHLHREFLPSSAAQITAQVRPPVSTRTPAGLDISRGYAGVGAFAGFNDQVAKNLAGLTGFRSSAFTNLIADVAQTQKSVFRSAAFAGFNDQVAKTFADIAGVRSPAWRKAMADLTRTQSIWADLISGLSADDHAEPEVRTESGLIIPSPTETLIFGGFQIDPERAFFAAVFTGLLLPVIMAPQFAPVRETASWAVWLLPVIYHALGRRRGESRLRKIANEIADHRGGDIVRTVKTCSRCGRIGEDG